MDSSPHRFWKVLVPTGSVFLEEGVRGTGEGDFRLLTLIKFHSSQIREVQVRILSASSGSQMLPLWSNLNTGLVGWSLFRLGFGHKSPGYYGNTLEGNNLVLEDRGVSWLWLRLQVLVETKGWVNVDKAKPFGKKSRPRFQLYALSGWHAIGIQQPWYKLMKTV